MLPGTRLDRVGRTRAQGIEAVALAITDDQAVLGTRVRLDRLIRRYGEAVWVYVAVTKIAQSAAGIPWRVVRENEQGEEEIVNTGPLPDLMKRPNSFQSQFDFIEAAQSSMELAGESFIELDRGLTGSTRPREMFVLPIFDQDTMKVIRGKPVDGRMNGPISGYIYTVQGKRVAFTPDEIIHTFYHNPFDPFRGWPPLRAAALSVDSDVKAHEYNNIFFANSAEPRGHFESEGTVTESQWKRWMRMIESRHKGHKKSHRPLLLKGVSWKQTQLNPKDVELLKLMQLSREEQIAVFGVRPVVVGLLDKNPQANAEIQWRDFWTTTMVPKTKKLEDKLNSDLAPLFNGGNLKIRRDFSAVPAMAEDFTGKLADAMRLQMLGYPTNQINKRLNLGMDDLDWGDTILVNPLQVPIETILNGSGNGEQNSLPERALVARLMNFVDQVEKEQIHVSNVPQLPAASLETAKELALKRWEHRQGEAEDKATTRFEDLFEAQKRRVIKNLGIDGALRQNEPVSYDLSIIFDRAFELGEMQGLSEAVIRETLLEAMLAFSFDFGLDETTFDFASDEILKFIDGEAFLQAKNITATTQKRLAKHLTEAINAGESVDQIKERIEATFKRRASDSRTIARTETVAASNFGAHEAAGQAGVESKSWISSRDLLVRDPHRLIDTETTGTPIPMGSPFTMSDGSQLRFPGDGSLGAGAEQIINCRCAMLFFFDDD